MSLPKKFALTFFRKPIPDNGEPSTFRDSVARADAARDRKRWGEAALSYREALRVDGTKSWLWIQYGHALKEGGDLAGAVDAYERAVALAPDDAEPLLHLAHLLKRLGDPGAIARFERLKKLTRDPAIDREVEQLAAVHQTATEQAAGHPRPDRGTTGRRGSENKLDADAGLRVVERGSPAAKPAAPPPGIYARSRGVRYVAEVRGRSDKHKLTLTVDGRRVWSGLVTAARRDSADAGLIDVVLSFPEPEESTTVRRVHVEAATVGPEPPAARIELPYASRFDGTARIVERTRSGCVAEIVFTDSEALTNKPTVRARKGDGSQAELKVLRQSLRSKEDGGTELVCCVAVTCAGEEVAGLAFFPMWSTQPLAAGTDEGQTMARDRLAAESDFRRERNTPNVKLDWIKKGFAGGWARLPLDPDAKVVIDILHGDAVLASGVADKPRPDLARAFASTGRHGFEIEISPHLPEGTTIRARVRSPGPQPTTVEREVPAPAAGLLKHPADPSAVLSGMVETSAGRTMAGASWPSVGMVVLNKDGSELLRALLDSVVRCNTHPSLEVIVVDHNSADDSRMVTAAFEGRLDVRFFNRGFNGSFSSSNNLGASLTDAEVLFFLNNDTVLLEDAIPTMASYFHRLDVGAVGARLVDRWGMYLDGLAEAAVDQHLGVFFRGAASGPRMFELRASPYASVVSRSVVRVPAVTGAAIMVRRSDFNAVGGFDERFFYGQEDVDLCLRIARAGRTILCDNRRAIGHFRGFTRAKSGRTDNGWFARAQARNRRVVERTHARYVHSLFRRTILGRAHLTGGPLQVALLVTSLSKDALAGDIFTAEEFAAAIARELPAAEVRFVAPAPNGTIDVADVDVLISLRDDFDVRTYENLSPACHVVFWVRNSFDRFLASENWQYADDVWMSSEREKARFEHATGLPARLLRIATNWDRFADAEPDRDYECDYCFTGSRWGAHREITVHLAPETIDAKFLVFGSGWERDPAFAPFHFGTLRYGEMPKVYASTRVVVDDANHVTVESGSVNSRVFDAIAAGALPVTNGLVGADEVFHGALPTYSSAQELHAVLTTYLADDAERRGKVAQLQAIVRERHTYAHRARDVVRFIREAEQRRPSVAIKIAAPNRQSREEWGDFHFAEALRSSLASLGMRAGIFHLEEWDSAAAAAADVALVLRGLERARIRPHQINVQWLMSHPDKVSLEECRGYNHVFVASERIHRDLVSRGVPSSLAHQCTDATRFRPDVEWLPGAPDVLFVGNSRGVVRRIVADAIAVGLDVHVYGEGWAGLIPSGFVKGTHISNAELPRWYASSGVVLNDHWPSMAEAGLVSNRVFDVVACGGRCVSDENGGISGLFGDAVRTYSDPSGLAALVAELLRSAGSDGANRLKAAEMVRNRHSFAQRAELIVCKIMELTEECRPGEARKSCGLEDLRGA